MAFGDEGPVLGHGAALVGVLAEQLAHPADEPVGRLVARRPPAG